MYFLGSMYLYFQKLFWIIIYLFFRFTDLWIPWNPNVMVVIQVKDFFLLPGLGTGCMAGVWAFLADAPSYRDGEKTYFYSKNKHLKHHPYIIFTQTSTSLQQTLHHYQQRNLCQQKIVNALLIYNKHTERVKLSTMAKKTIDLFDHLFINSVFP